MSKNYNVNIPIRLRRQLGIKEGLDNEVFDKIVPAVNILPTISFARNGTSNTSASTTNVLTTPTDKDFYLTGASLSYEKDSTCDTAPGQFIRLAVTIQGVSRSILLLPHISVTASNGSVTLNVGNSLGIKLDRNTNINLILPTFSLGTYTGSMSIFGYTEEIITETAS